jgi:hypothetical protein
MKSDRSEEAKDRRSQTRSYVNTIAIPILPMAWDNTERRSHFSLASNDRRMTVGGDRISNVWDSGFELTRNGV